MATSNLEHGQGRKLYDYWTAGKGLTRWADSPTPYRTLLAALASEGVPAQSIHGLAANLYMAVFHKHPGKQGGSAQAK